MVGYDGATPPSPVNPGPFTVSYWERFDIHGVDFGSDRLPRGSISRSVRRPPRSTRPAARSKRIYVRPVRGRRVRHLLRRQLGRHQRCLPSGAGPGPTVVNVTYTIDPVVQPQNSLTFEIPAGSFQVVGDPAERRFEFTSPAGDTPHLEAMSISSLLLSSW